MLAGPPEEDRRRESGGASTDDRDIARNRNRKGSRQTAYRLPTDGSVPGSGFALTVNHGTSNHGTENLGSRTAEPGTDARASSVTRSLIVSANPAAHGQDIKADVQWRGRHLLRHQDDEGPNHEQSPRPDSLIATSPQRDRKRWDGSVGLVGDRTCRELRHARPEESDGCAAAPEELNAGGRERGRPAGRGAVSRDKCMSGELPVVLFADRTRHGSLAS